MAVILRIRPVASAVLSGQESRAVLLLRLRWDSAPYSNLEREFVSVAIGNRKSKIENLLAGVVQW
jgi:hypothetical protein